MKVHCPKCKASYKIEDSKIPEKGAHVNCPKCKTRFLVKKESEGVGKVCPNCGYERQPRDDEFTPISECPKCGIIYSKAKILADRKQQEALEENKIESTDKDDSIETEEFETKNCPYCAETIKAEAIKCRYCGESLVDDDGVQDKAASPKKEKSGCRTGCGFLILIGIIGILAAILIPKLNSPPEKTGERITRPPKATKKMPVSTKNYSYKIIKAERFRTIKSVLTVRLSKKISKKALLKLALELRAKEPKTYDRMFIMHYLPGMEVGAGAWATTHFNPNLEIRVLGSTIEEEKKLLIPKKIISGNIIGIWFDELYGKYTIIKKGSGYILETKYKDGSGGTDDLIKFKFHGKTAFKEKSEDRGEYFVIESSGKLGLYDSMGLIATLRVVK